MWDPMIMMVDTKQNLEKILVVSWPGVGHVNACSGLTLPLLNRGYRVAFLIENSYKGKLKALGFEELIYESYSDSIIQNSSCQNPGEKMSQQLLQNEILGQTDKLKALDQMIEFFFKSDYAMNNFKHWNNSVKEATAKYDPDLFIVDSKILLPAIFYSGKPWILNISSVPTFSLHGLEDPQLPPACSGLSIDSDKSEWIPYKKILHGLYFNEKFQKMVEELGYERFPNNCTCPQTQVLNVYAFPEEYNYPPLQKLAKNWFNIEVFNKPKIDKTTKLQDFVPNEFFNDDLDGKFTGNWIYVSMGSMGSADLNFMKRMIGVLAKTNHKYVISKGPKHQEYDLERNMWGDRFLPQIQILPFMDLVITHGGNNSITETFAQGKPMIIFPLFADQLDNGQRLHETNYATRLNTYSFTEKELIESIDRLLNDDKLKTSLKKASDRIQKSTKHESFCDLVEKILHS